MRGPPSLWLVLFAVLGAAAASARPVSPVRERIGLRAAGSGLPRTGQWRQGFALADIDGDGILDVVHGPPRGRAGGTPRVFLGDGRGGFRDAAPRLPDLDYVYGDAGVGDLDGDGLADIALAMHLRGLLVLWGEASGGFGVVNDSPPRLDPFPSRSLEVVDLDRDGTAEVVALAEGPLPSARVAEGVVVLRWDRDRRRSTLRLPTPASHGRVVGDVLAVGDLDGSDRLDVIVAPARRGAPVQGWHEPLQGAGGGWLELLSPGADGWITAIAIVDLGEGPELVVAAGEPAGRGRILRAAVAPEASPILRVDTAVSAISAADVDGDGARDLVLLTAAGGLLAYGRAPDGRWRPAGALPEAGAGCGGSALRSGDLDGDGRDDLVASFASEPDDSCPDGGRMAAWLAARPR